MEVNKLNEVNGINTENLFKLFDLKQILSKETNRELIDSLREFGYIRKNRIYPEQKYIDNGYFLISERISKGDIVSTIYLTNSCVDEIAMEFGCRVDWDSEVEFDEYGDPILTYED